MDLMFLDVIAVLHAVDTAMRFSAAPFLDSYGQTYGKSVDSIWLAFLKTWASIYTGYLNRVCVKQISLYTSDRWIIFAKDFGIKVRFSGVKAQISLGIGERLHEPLKRIFNSASMDFSQLNAVLLLKIAAKAMTDTIGENGLVPSKLVFG